jgi:hypothetical protein
MIPPAKSSQTGSEPSATGWTTRQSLSPVQVILLRTYSFTAPPRFLANYAAGKKTFESPGMGGPEPAATP